MDASFANHPALDAASQRPQKPQKRMRKGTRSCTECRRRKIRCVFGPGSLVCTRCSARGSECVDQRDDVGLDDTSEGWPRPRTHISPPGQYWSPNSHGSSRPGQRQDRTRIRDGEHSDLEISSDRRPPLVSVLGDGENSVSAAGALSSADSAAPSPTPILLAGRPGGVCEALRAALPSYDEITTVLASNNAWWDSFRQKTRTITGAEPVEPLLSFAARAYTSPKPAEVATLAVAFGRALGRDHRIFSLVDSLVIADTSLAATLDGMECLILLAKTYTDIGQPRRAWLTWRKGLAFAQLMGLYRTGPGTPAIRQRIWLAVYHGDRFTSLLLGLPHGFNDGFLGDFVLGGIVPGPLNSWLPQFIHQCAVMAGQVIEHILSPASPSFAKAMDLDERMDSISASAPPGWWETPTHLPGDRAELNLLIDRLLIHFFFFHVRMYVHLPFLKPAPQSPLRDVSRVACTAAARQMLKRYLVLRTETERGSLFDCKTSDFVSFTAAVVLQLGLCNPTKVPSGPLSEDPQLIEDVGSVYWALEKGSGCKIAAQCRKALALLSSPMEEGTSEQGIPIPYFGSIIRRRAVHSNQGWEDDGAINTCFQPTPSDSIVVSAFDANTSDSSSYSTDYMGYQVWDFAMGETWLGPSADSINVSPSFDLDLTGLDIDQDWMLLFPQSASG